MKSDFSCGVIPVLLDGSTRRYLLVQHDAGHWAFPKGHPEKGETDLQTARRELVEETGLARVNVLETQTFEEAYVFTKRSGKTVRKRVSYLLGLVEPGQVVRLQAAEVKDHAWGDAAATAERMSFDEGRRLLAEVEAFIDAGNAASIGL